MIHSGASPSLLFSAFKKTPALTMRSGASPTLLFSAFK